MTDSFTVDWLAAGRALLELGRAFGVAAAGVLNKMHGFTSLLDKCVITCTRCRRKVRFMRGAGKTRCPHCRKRLFNRADLQALRALHAIDDASFKLSAVDLCRRGRFVPTVLGLWFTWTGDTLPSYWEPDEPTPGIDWTTDWDLGGVIKS